MTYYDEESDFLESWRAVQKDVHSTARERGWYDNPHLDSTSADAMRIALMHSELSEALEALRHGNPPDDKIPLFSGAEAELADVVIRIMDFAEYRGHDVARAIIAKAEMNKTREYKHGGKTF